METIPSMKGLNDYFMKNSIAFKEIYDSLKANEEPLPGEWKEKLNSF